MTLVCAFTSTSDFFCARSKQCWFWRGKKGEQRCCAVLCARACREVGDFSTPPTLSPSKIHAAVYILPAETPSQLSPGNSCWYCHGTIFPLFVVVMVVSGTAISTAPAALRSPASCCPAPLLRTPSVGANICIPHDPTLHAIILHGAVGLHCLSSVLGWAGAPWGSSGSGMEWSSLQEGWAGLGCTVPALRFSGSRSCWTPPFLVSC